METLKKGQIAGGVAENMLALLVIVAIAFVTLQVAASLEDSIDLAATTANAEAIAAHQNFSTGLWDSYQLMSLTPYLIGALVVISLVVGFAKVVGVGRL